MTSLDPGDERSLVLVLSMMLAALLGTIGVVAAGVAVWQWASTSPDLVIGLDISPEAVIAGVIMLLLVGAALGLALLYHTLRWFDGDEDVSDEHYPEDDSAGGVGGDTDGGRGRDQPAGSPTETVDSSEGTEAETETDIVGLDDGPKPGEVADSPNRTSSTGADAPGGLETDESRESAETLGYEST